MISYPRLKLSLKPCCDKILNAALSTGVHAVIRKEYLPHRTI
ncbi:MAG: hypothetical protein ACTS73_06045 [Arsenophonus sp. NEOnobi-MAG3]